MVIITEVEMKEAVDSLKAESVLHYKNFQNSHKRFYKRCLHTSNSLNNSILYIESLHFSFMYTFIGCHHSETMCSGSFNCCYIRKGKNRLLQ